MEPLYPSPSPLAIEGTRALSARSSPTGAAARATAVCLLLIGQDGDLVSFKGPAWQRALRGAP